LHVLSGALGTSYDDPPKDLCDQVDKNIHMEPLGDIGSQPGLKWFDKGKLYRKAEGSKLPVYGH